MEKFTRSWYWNNILIGPIAALIMNDFLSRMTPQEIINFATARLRNFQTLFSPIETDKTTRVSGKKLMELYDSGVLQLLEMLRHAFFSKDDTKADAMYLRYIMKFFPKLPYIVRNTDTTGAPYLSAYTKSKEHIVKTVMNTWAIPDTENHSLFEFLVRIYTDKGRLAIESIYDRIALDEMRKFIEGLLRDKLSRDGYLPQDIFYWAKLDPPESLLQILLIALVKKENKDKIMEAFSSNIFTVVTAKLETEISTE